MKYNKQPLDIPAQIAMLKGRGLNIADVSVTLGLLLVLATRNALTVIVHLFSLAALSPHFF